MMKLKTLSLLILKVNQEKLEENEEPVTFFTYLKIENMFIP
jgi:hypothetical protein